MVAGAHMSDCIVDEEAKPSPGSQSSCHQGRGQNPHLKAFVMLGLAAGRSDGAPSPDVHCSSLPHNFALIFPLSLSLPRKGSSGEEMVVKSSCCLSTPHQPLRFTVVLSLIHLFPTSLQDVSFLLTNTLLWKSQELCTSLLARVWRERDPQPFLSIFPTPVLVPRP